jgi:hypothetical protein
MTLEEIIAELRARATQTVPFAGEAIGELKRGAAYAAGKNGTLGVPVFWSGGKLRTASIDIARRLGVEDAVTAPAMTNQPTEIKPALTVATPVIQPAAPKSPPSRSRMALTPNAAAPPSKAPVTGAARKSKANERERAVA